MSARDEPSYLAFARTAVRHGEPVSALTAQELVARIDRDAASLKAAQPRTITTAEELDALPEKAVVLDCDGDPWQKVEFGGWRHEVARQNSFLVINYAPITVLYVPEAKS